MRKVYVYEHGGGGKGKNTLIIMTTTTRNMMMMMMILKGGERVRWKMKIEVCINNLETTNSHYASETF